MKKNKIMEKLERTIYENGFKTYYFVCQKCGCETNEQINDGSFSPPTYKCTKCGESVTNNPIVIEYHESVNNDIRTRIESKQNIKVNRFVLVDEILRKADELEHNKGTLLHLMAVYSDKELKDFHTHYVIKQ